MSYLRTNKNKNQEKYLNFLNKRVITKLLKLTTKICQLYQWLLKKANREKEPMISILAY